MKFLTTSIEFSLEKKIFLKKPKNCKDPMNYIEKTHSKLFSFPTKKICYSNNYFLIIWGSGFKTKSTNLNVLSLPHYDQGQNKAI